MNPIYQSPENRDVPVARAGEATRAAPGGVRECRLPVESEVALCA